MPDESILCILSSDDIFLALLIVVCYIDSQCLMLVLTLSNYLFNNLTQFMCTLSDPAFTRREHYFCRYYLSLNIINMPGLLGFGERVYYRSGLPPAKMATDVTGER